MAKRETPNAQRFRRGKVVAKSFTDALIANDFAAAYALSSSRLRHRLDIAAFAAQHQQAWRTHGKPVAVIGFDHGGVGADLDDG